MISAIRTPDQRLRVFVSSTLEELAAERSAARAAIEKLRLQPVMFELGARPHPAQKLYRAYLEASDIFIGIYGERYGWVGPGMDISGLEDEYLSAGDRPKLIYLKRPAEAQDPQLADMIARIRDSGSVSYKGFSTPEELQELIENDLAILLSEAYGYGTERPGESTTERPAEAMLPGDPTPLVGRDEEVREIVDMLSSGDVRLLTLTGPGGTGKSRLAVQVARSFAGRMRVGFVSLSTISSRPLVLPTIAQALEIRGGDGKPPDEALVEMLTSTPTLLVLDNLEQVLDAAPDIAQLLAKIQHLKVVVTSRAVLRLRGEREFVVRPLPVPDAKAGGDLVAYPAVRLFVDRARAVQPDLEPTPDQLAIVAEICRRLDGLPLAIELASARVRVLSLTSILERLVDRFALLGGGTRDLPDRQRTLRDTIDWSYQLLDEEEQAVFAQLAVFVGGRTLEAVEEVCNPDGDRDILGAITSFVEKSLLRREDGSGGEIRFTMLESIRAFALERLEAADEFPELRRRHANYFLRFAETASSQLRGPHGADWIRRMTEEDDNMRAALTWSQENDATLLLRFVALLAPFWIVNGNLGEGLAWTERALDGGQGDARLRAEVMRRQGEICWGMGQRDRASAVYEECQKLYEELGDEEGLDLTLRGIGRIALDVGDYAIARELYESSLKLQRKLGRTRNAAETLNNLGVVASLSGDHAAAMPLFEECASLFRELDDQQGIARADLNLSVTLRALGDLEQAEEYGKRSLKMWRDLGGKWDIADCLEALGSIAIDQNDARTGLVLLGAAEQLRIDIGAPRAPFDEELLMTAKNRAREQLGSAADGLLRSGRDIGLERAIDMALWQESLST